MENISLPSAANTNTNTKTNTNTNTDTSALGLRETAAALVGADWPFFSKPELQSVKYFSDTCLTGFYSMLTKSPLSILAFQFSCISIVLDILQLCSTDPAPLSQVNLDYS